MTSVLLIRSMSRRLQAVVLFAIVSLIANLQCYAACFSSALNSAARAEACHHMPDPGQGDSGCGHGHSHAPAVTALPDNPAISGAHLATIFSTLPVTIPASEIVQNAALHAASCLHASPPGRSLFLVLSVLRI